MSEKRPTKCSECKVELEKGAMVVKISMPLTQQYAKLPEGKRPQDNRFGETRSVTALRCPSCGHINLYASEDILNPNITHDQNLGMHMLIAITIVVTISILAMILATL